MAARGQVWGVAAATYLIQLVYVVVGRSFIERFIGLLYGFNSHLAWPQNRAIFWSHPLLSALLSGLVLGLLPLHAIASGAGLLKGPTERLVGGWQRSKPWVVIPFALWLLVSIVAYSGDQPSGTLSALQAFFVAPCSLDAAHVLIYHHGCANQVLVTAPFTCALAYSLSAFAGRPSTTDREHGMSTAETTGEIV